ncbi:MAG: hypothetical protein K2Q06_00035, partial [Parvularculaceae bacterium]|nr:hypothetical protein [Parvularculaceae bacterium]
ARNSFGEMGVAMNKGLLIGAAAAVLLAAVGGGAYYFLVLGKDGKSPFGAGSAAHIAPDGRAAGEDAKDAIGVEEGGQIRDDASNAVDAVDPEAEGAGDASGAITDLAPPVEGADPGSGDVVGDADPGAMHDEGAPPPDAEPQKPAPQGR